VPLPFALYGLTGVVQADSVSVEFLLLNRSLSVAAQLLGFSSLRPDIQHIRVIPDNHGVANYSVAVLKFPEAINLENLSKSKERYRSFLNNIARTLNPIISFYNLAKQNFGVGSVSAQDFNEVVAWHEVSTQPGVAYDSVYVLLPDTDLDFQPADRTPDSSVKAEIERLSRLDPSYRTAFLFYAQARRFFAGGDHVLAAIQAITSLEIALPHFIRGRIEAGKDQFGEQRLKWKDYEDTRKDVPFAFLMLSIFPLLIPDVRFPREIVTACNTLRKKRNHAVHELQKFTHVEEQELLSVGDLLDFLVKHHPALPSAERPG
jgi:hypothetical protein